MARRPGPLRSCILDVEGLSQSQFNRNVGETLDVGASYDRPPTSITPQVLSDGF